MWHLRKPTVAQGWRSPLWQQAEWESVVSLLYWTDLLTEKELDYSYVELSISVWPLHQKSLGGTGVNIQPHVEQCANVEENGQLFSDRVPKYMTFILQGIIKLSDLVCPCMEQQDHKEVLQIFVDEASKLHEITGKYTLEK